MTRFSYGMPLCLFNLLHAQYFFTKKKFSADFFQIDIFKILVSNILDSDQARQNVGPDLGPNCLTKFISRRHQQAKA